MDASEIKSVFKLAPRVGEILLVNRAATRAVEATMLGGNAVEIVVCFLIMLPAQFCKQWIAEKNVPSPLGDLFAASVCR